MTVLAQLFLFISSYAPLAGVFALLNSFGSGWPTWICAGLAIAGLVLPIGVSLSARRIGRQSLNVASAQVQDGDALAYIATYLVPFAAASATTGRERGALGLVRHNRDCNISHNVVKLLLRSLEPCGPRRRVSDSSASPEQ